MSTNNIRQSVVSGQFYPASKEDLEEQVRNFLDQTESSQANKQIKALMVPHAGYTFSGGVAATAYKQVQNRKVGTVILMCNSHSDFFEGVAVSDADYWETPLGNVEVNKDLADKLVEVAPCASFNNEAHEGDHTLEVQIPFLQVALKEGFKILPISFGNIEGEDYKQIAEALSGSLGSSDLVIASSDMSHFPPYEEANRIDPKTLEFVKDLDVENLENHLAETLEQGVAGEETLLCGIDGVKTVMIMSHILGWENGEILEYKNSGDIFKDSKDSVVGYGAVMFLTEEEKSEEPKNVEYANLEYELKQEQKDLLLKIARESVESYVLRGETPEFKVVDQELNEPKGAFVTIKKGEELRGCIGQIVQTEKPLWQVVRNMAIAAAVKDNRFEPIKEEELPELSYEVSVLSIPEKINNWQNIELGKHGVIVRKGENSGVFLPQVAEEAGMNKEEFLSQLCWQKAGLMPEAYKNDEDLEMYVFTTEVFS